MSNFSIFSVRTRPVDEQWIYTKRQLAEAPSILAGKSIELELQAREDAVKRIWALRDIVEADQLSVNAAIIYMHRFYMQETMMAYEPNDVAAAALFLAGKVEENQKKISSVVEASLNLDDPTNDKVGNMILIHIDRESTLFLETRKKLIFMEEVMIRVLNFDLTVRHPHWSLIKGVNKVWGKDKGKEKEREGRVVIDAGYRFCNDSLSTPICLLYHPNVIAAATVVLACALHSIPLPPLPQEPDDSTREEGEEPQELDQYWLVTFEVEVEQVKDAVKIIANRYVKAQSADVVKEAKKLLIRANRLAATISPIPIPIPITNSSLTSPAASDLIISRIEEKRELENSQSSNLSLDLDKDESDLIISSITTNTIKEEDSDATSNVKQEDDTFSNNNSTPNHSNEKDPISKEIVEMGMKNENGNGPRGMSHLMSNNNEDDKMEVSDVKREGS